MQRAKHEGMGGGEKIESLNLLANKSGLPRQ